MLNLFIKYKHPTPISNILFILICGIIAFNSSVINAQEQINEPQQVEALLLKSKGLAQTNIDSSYFYATKAAEKSKLINSDTLLAKSNLQQSSLLIFKKEFSKSDSLLQENLTKILPKHIKGLTIHNLATIQYYKQDFQKALELYVQAAGILEQTKKTEQLVSTYSNIGTINASLKNYKNAQIYLERALALSDFDEVVKLQILVNLCNIYYNEKQFKKYTESIFKAEELAIKYNSKNTLSTIYNNLSIYFTNDGADYNKAVSYGKKAIALKKELNSTNTLNVTYNNIGNAYLKRQEYQKAISFLDSASIGAQGLLKSYIFNNLKESYLGLKQYKTALHYADLKDKIKDSITNQKQKESVAELTEKYESEKKEQRINILDTENKLQALTIKQQNYLLAALALFVLLIIILGYFGFKSYKIQQQLDKVLLQQRLRKMQLNPHFLFNALQSIQNFIHQNDKEKSSSYLTSYSKLIRLVLEKSDDDFITVEDDKAAIESYLSLQLLNYNNTFSFKINIEESVDEDFDMLPTLITQPFVENAILHGLKNNDNGIISVKYYKRDSILHVSITDNGKGFEAKKDDSNRLHKSMSMEIIKEQLKNLNKSSEDFKGDIEVTTTSNGTEVLLSFTTM
ncbi:two-component sensor kinase YesM [Algibacter lectus]|uniref:Two-component sensor kinase YesM n=1 Tax=Algibacter lectus TaxID=221126 RepID=A0A090X5C5_9FLAO|nr:tetratricopeptide repeat protein [Algibacter lectus]GAL79292.1 two-component sensor kinase YesM [Algibacter lectus]SFD72624.1 Tetratricopeptide repeat-containing protein [Algibacter lectus]